MSDTVIHPEALPMPAAAAAAGISRAMLYRLLADGRGPRVVRLGRRTLVRREALAEWLRKLEEETEQPA